MNIKIEGNIPPRLIEELDWGEVFVLSEKPDADRRLYMVIEPDYNLGTDYEYDVFAIRLEDGTIWGFDGGTPIIRAECTLTAKV